MIVGFTGTREGCTVPQAGFLELILRERLKTPGSVLHQGCCVGADAQAVAIVRRLFAGAVTIVGHPGNWAPPEWGYLAPLLKLRELYLELARPRNRLQKVGERTASGRLSSRPMRLGPLLLDVRERALAEVLAVQSEVNEAADRLGRPRIDLINPEEESRIRELIALGTWPQGWDGTEGRGGEASREVMRDGTVQHTIWGFMEEGITG